MDSKFSQPFFDSMKAIVKQMAGIKVDSIDGFFQQHDEIISYGVSSIINYVGKIKGRMLWDMEPEVALAIARNVTGEYNESHKDFMVMATISEMNNMIAGDANTCLNNLYSLGMRLAPPVVLTGTEMIISIPNLPSATMECKTDFGNMKINIAFERGI